VSLLRVAYSVKINMKPSPLFISKRI